MPKSHSEKATEQVYTLARAGLRKGEVARSVGVNPRTMSRNKNYARAYIEGHNAPALRVSALLDNLLNDLQGRIGTPQQTAQDISALLGVARLIYKGRTDREAIAERRRHYRALERAKNAEEEIPYYIPTARIMTQEEAAQYIAEDYPDRAEALKYYPATVEEARGK